MGQLLWSLAEYRTGSTYPYHPPMEQILETLNLPEIRRVKAEIDGMLVHLAFKVRKLEPERDEGDKELAVVRRTFRNNHSWAVQLGLAEENPKTYFDRAVPAAQSVNVPL